MARPCIDCPFRTDAPLQHFPKERYEALANTSRQPDQHGGTDAALDAPLFGCHMQIHADAACAGWLAVEGRNHIGIRLALVEERLSPEALAPGPDWPSLYASYLQMVEAQGYQPDA